MPFPILFPSILSFCSPAVFFLPGIPESRVGGRVKVRLHASFEELCLCLPALFPACKQNHSLSVLTSSTEQKKIFKIVFQA